MNQLSIVYFWPLTEQIPLDLDYSDCKKPQLTMPIGVGGTTVAINNGWNGITTFAAARLQLDVDTTVIKSNTKPPLIRRGLYKLLGLKWEIK